MAKIVNRVNFLFPAARPGGGHELASYTAAFLELSGMDAGALVPMKDMIEVMGRSAFNWHCKRGVFEKTEDGVKLTEAGFLHFANMGKNRGIRVIPEMLAAYRLTMETGKVSAMVKNPSLIVPFV